MDFKFVLMALTFMFLINFVAASMSGYNFMDQFTVQNAGVYSQNITLSPACDAALGIATPAFLSKGKTLDSNVLLFNCEQKCYSELQSNGLTACYQLNTIIAQSGFGKPQTESSGLGSLGDLFATVITFVGSLLAGIVTFFTVAMQILISPKNLDSFNIVIDMINAVCVVVVIAWVWKAILPTASD